MKQHTAGPTPERETKSGRRNLVYSCRAWCAFLLCGSVGACGVLLVPSVRGRRRWLRRCARTAFFLAGIEVRVAGLQYLRSRRSVVVVSNHASYLDVVLFTAVLPPHVSYVAKKELSLTPFLGWFLRRIRTYFLERFRARTSINDLNEIKEAVRKGDTVLFFPEGTFTSRPGLMPFRMGGFLVAAETGTPVVPVAVAGTRKILSSTSWWVLQGSIEVTIFEPISSRSSTKKGAAEVRDQSREVILSRCGEPEIKPPVLERRREGDAEP